MVRRSCRCSARAYCPDVYSQVYVVINQAVMDSTEAVKASTIYAVHCLLCIEVSVDAASVPLDC